MTAAIPCQTNRQPFFHCLEDSLTFESVVQNFDLIAKAHKIGGPETRRDRGAKATNSNGDSGVDQLPSQKSVAPECDRRVTSTRRCAPLSVPSMKYGDVFTMLGVCAI